MKKLIKIFICILISTSFSFIYIKLNKGKNSILKCTECNITSKMLKNESTVDIKNIKNEIFKIEEAEKPPVVDITKSENIKEYFKQNNIFMLGDSFVEGMSCYGALYPNNAIWQRGIRVDNMSKQLDKAKENNAKTIILMYGANDMQVWKDNVDGYINSYKKTLNEIKEKFPEIKIFIHATFPANENGLKKDPPYKYINDYNNRLEELCKEEGIPFINCNDLLLASPDSYQKDGIHLKSSFYQEWIKKLALEITKVK